MSNLINFFFSFDKLMKERLVLPLFWLVVIYFGINQLSEIFDAIGIDFLDGTLDFINLFVGFVAIFVGARLALELAVAIFRINDNLSPDKGVSETADIDPVAEARRAAEDAARRARLAASNTLDKTQSVTRRAVDSTKAAAATAAAKVEDTVEDVTDRVKGVSDLDPDDVDTLGAKDLADGDGFPDPQTLTPVAKAEAYTVSGDVETPKAKATTKAASAPVKRGPGRPKGSKTEVIRDPVTGQRLKKDGTPWGKPGPKPSGTAKPKPKADGAPKKRGRPKGSKNVVRLDPVTGERLKKDGTPYKKPGPKPKA